MLGGGQTEETQEYYNLDTDRTDHQIERWKRGVYIFDRFYASNLKFWITAEKGVRSWFKVPVFLAF